MIRAIFTAGMESDIREVLTAVTAPTVVMMTRDGSQSEAVVREVADLLPNSQFHVLPASTESDGLEGLFAPIVDLVERLVTGATATQTGERLLAAVLFTDIVGSTEQSTSELASAGSRNQAKCGYRAPSVTSSLGRECGFTRTEATS